jgi:hypothetical protein
MRRQRLENWPAAMRAVLAVHRAAPFAWGSSDCSVAFDVVAAITGFDPIEAVRGYSSEISALRALRREGFETCLALVEKNFVEIAAAHAMRGDLGYPAAIPHPLMSPAVIDGPLAYSKSPGEGWVVVPTASLTRIFAV